jgi:YD repeat-containing protein
MAWFEGLPRLSPDIPDPEDIELSENLPTGGMITACKSITLRPGFSFQASPGKSLVLTIVLTKSSTGSPVQKTYYDALHREIRSGQERMDGIFLQTDTEYDYVGRIAGKSSPYKGGSPVLWNTYSYDDYNRLESLQYASGKTETYFYQPNSVTAVIDGVTQQKIYDVTGKLVNVIDTAGIITCNYRPDGQPVSITVPGNITTSFEYDIYGRRTKIIDPSAGTQEYVYDAAGWKIPAKDPAIWQRQCIIHYIYCCFGQYCH